LRRFIILLCVILMLLVAVPVFACYSGLNLIPTVDMLDKGSLSLDLQIEGKVDGLQSDTWILNSQYGLSDRLELGVDHDFSDGASPRNLLNAKFLLPAAATLKMPIALGICNVANESKPDLYVVTAYEASIARLHFGVGKFSSENQWFVGLDKDVLGCTLMLEYMQGQANFSAIGFSRDISKNLAASVGFEHPNDDSDNRYTMHITWTFPFCGNSK